MSGFAILFLILLLSGAALALQMALAQRRRQVAIGKRLAQLGEQRVEVTSFAERMMRLSARVGSKSLKGDDTRNEDLERMMVAAGFLRRGALYQFAAIRIATALVFGLIGFFFANRMEDVLLFQMLAIVFVALVVGYFVATLVLRAMAEARRAEVRREMPFFLDLMLLLLRSGVSVDQMFRQLADERAGVLPETHRVTVGLVEDINRGVSYEDALDKWAFRLAIPEAEEIASILQESLTHGTDLADRIRVQIQTSSERRVTDARGLVGKRVTQMTVVMLLFFLPPLVTMLIAPGLSQLAEILN